jgi:hypothetical protein
MYDMNDRDTIDSLMKKFRNVELTNNNFYNYTNNFKNTYNNPSFSL